MRVQLQVLFVCSGNTCRSVMAQGLFDKMWNEMEEGGGMSIEARSCSAGTAAVEGVPPSQEAVAVLGEEGIDFTGHRAQKVKKEMLQEASYIFAMTEGHKFFILNRFPEVAGKVWTLGEFVGEEGADIPDPYGAEMEYYRKVAENIKKKIKQAITKLKHSHG